MENIGYIYALIDPRTEEIRYIGKTCNIKERFNKHKSTAKHCRTHKEKWINSLQKINLQPKLKILITSIEQLLNNLEIELIKHYKQFCKLVNGTAGGDGTRKPQTEKVKERMRNNNPMHNKEIAIFVNRKNAVNKCKIVYQFDKLGNFIKKYNSIKEAANINKICSSTIIRVCNKVGSYKSAGGYTWSYKKEII